MSYDGVHFSCATPLVLHAAGDFSHQPAGMNHPHDLVFDLRRHARPVLPLLICALWFVLICKQRNDRVETQLDFIHLLTCEVVFESADLQASSPRSQEGHGCPGAHEHRDLTWLLRLKLFSPPTPSKASGSRKSTFTCRFCAANGSSTFFNDKLPRHARELPHLSNILPAGW